MKKVLVIKIGSRIAYNAKDTSGGNGEAKSIVDMLYKGGLDVHICTKILNKDVNPDHLTFWDIEKHHKDLIDMDFDALIVLNGTANFFGGVESPEAILNYWLINKFKSKVFYIFCDPSLPLRQIWPSMKNKEWSKNWKEEDILITRDDIVYISQPYAIDDVLEIQYKTGILAKKTLHYPFERFPLMKDKPSWKNDFSIDLSYGGTMRGNRRVKKMVKFYYGYPEDISVEMFGKIDGEILEKHAHKIGISNYPKLSPPVNYDEYCEKMSNSLAHVVIGDEWYEGRDMPQRCYESIWSGTITFIDIELDPEKRVFGKTGFCSEFNYVRSSEEVSLKIRNLKSRIKQIGSSVLEQIRKKQIESINWNEEDFCKQFVDILKMSNILESKTLQGVDKQEKLSESKNTKSKTNKIESIKTKKPSVIWDEDDIF